MNIAKAMEHHLLAGTALSKNDAGLARHHIGHMLAALNDKAVGLPKTPSVQSGLQPMKPMAMKPKAMNPVAGLKAKLSTFPKGGM